MLRRLPSAARGTQSGSQWMLRARAQHPGAAASCGRRSTLYTTTGTVPTLLPWLLWPSHSSLFCSPDRACPLSAQRHADVPSEPCDSLNAEVVLFCRADNAPPADSAPPARSAAAQSIPMEVAVVADDMPLSELLSPDSSRAVLTASSQTAEILQLLRRLEALNRCSHC